jgi:hypothetical protein
LSCDKKSSFLPENSVSVVKLTIGCSFFLISDVYCLFGRDIHHSHRTPKSLVRNVSQWSLHKTQLLHYMSHVSSTVNDGAKSHHHACNNLF